MSSELFGKPLGHDAVLDGLLRAARDKRLSHALLFEGPAGIGKFRAAAYLAAGLLCSEGPGEPCGACGPEKRLVSGNHPDLLVIDPAAMGEEAIRVNWIRRDEGNPPPIDPPLDEFQTLKPMEGGWRVVLLRDAERMNVNAQNALLKTLEEPGPETLLVLVVARPDLLLETVRSRCVPVEFEPLSKDDALAALAGSDLSGSQLELLSRWAQGSPGGALALARSDARAQRALFVEVLAGQRSPLSASAHVWELGGDFEGKTPAAAARARARSVVDLGLAALGDLLRFEAGMHPDELAHGDLMQALPPELSRRSLEAHLEVSLGAWLEAREDLARNLSPEACLDRAFLSLFEVAKGATFSGSRG